MKPAERVLTEWASGEISYKPNSLNKKFWYGHETFEEMCLQFATKVKSEPTKKRSIWNEVCDFILRFQGREPEAKRWIKRFFDPQNFIFFETEDEAIDFLDKATLKTNPRVSDPFVE